MKTSASLRSILALCAALLLSLLATGAAWGAQPPAQGVRIAAIGSPTWRPVDFHLFSAPVGTAESGYAEFAATMAALLPLPNHAEHPALGIGPGAPHFPPYDAEFAAGVESLGFREAVQFRSSEFSAGAGIWLVWMNVPAPGTTGSSPDFALGPVIPNALFPISVYAENLHNGKLFSVPAAFTVPALDDVDPPFAGDGHSHFPIFIADNADFGPPGSKLNGSYRLVVVMLDQQGHGWRIEAHFAVAP